MLAVQIHKAEAPAASCRSAAADRAAVTAATSTKCSEVMEFRVVQFGLGHLGYLATGTDIFKFRVFSPRGGVRTPYRKR